MVTVLNICKILKILLEICFLCICCSVNSGQHLIVLIASPVSTGRRCQLKCFDRLCAHQMWSGTELNEISLLIETELVGIRMLFDHLNLIRLISLCHQLDRLILGQCVTLQTVALLDDLLHLFLDGIQCISVKTWQIKIIIISVVDRRSDGQLCIRIQILYCLCQYMRTCVAVCFLSLVRIEGQNIQGTILIYNGTKILDLTINLSHTCYSCQSLADIQSDIVNGHWLVILLKGAIF